MGKNDSTENTERLTAYLQYLSAEQPADRAATRTAEYVWALVAIVLFVGWLESTDVSQYVIAEKKSEVKSCEKYAEVLAHVLTKGGVITAPGAEATCKVKHIPS